MAAYAAHLTRTLQGTPSVFQVTAQEALGATVKPALKKLVEYLATVYPNKFGWCLKYFDELYLVFDCYLQYHYLKHYAASFSERFYGLFRVPTTSNDFYWGQRLPVELEQGSLIFLCLIPYLKDKAEAYVDKWRAADDDGLLGKSRNDQARRAAINIYSTIHLVSSSYRAIQLARYMVGRADAHCPSLSLLGATLRDAPAAPEGGALWEDWWTDLNWKDYRSLMISFPMIGQVGLRVVEYGAFAVQFLRWWESRATRTDTSLPAPPPPVKDEKSIRMKNKCPICLQSWKIPTVLPVSGYIFCYVCISRHMRSHAACPVSRAPAAESSLVRLYLDT